MAGQSTPTNAAMINIRTRWRECQCFYYLTGLLLIASAGVAAAGQDATDCRPFISFFPDGSEDRNIPLAWGRTAQIAAGNYEKDKVFTIAMPSIVNIHGTDTFSLPVLQVLPEHDLLLAGKRTISGTCTGDAGSSHRKLLQLGNNTDSKQVAANSNPTNSSEVLMPAGTQPQSDADQHMDTQIDVPQQQQQDQTSGELHDSHEIQPQQREPVEPEWEVLYPARFKVQYQLNGTGTVDVGEFEDRKHPPRIILDMTKHDDGYYCMIVQVTILPWTGLLMPGSIAVPVKPLVSERQVCFYKMDSFPKADVSFATCSQEPLTVNISNIQPSPVPLYPGSDTPFLYPVVHFKAELNRTADFHWPPSTAITSLERWVIAADASEPYVWTPEDQVYEGWYNIHLDVSITTPYPSLMAVGQNALATYNETKAPEVIQGWFKYLSKQQFPPGTVLGIQHQLSRYRTIEGPTGMETFPMHVDVPFNWEFDGFGDTYCFVDGKPQHNWGNDQCMPPLNIQVSNRKNHTLTVIRKDVCGNVLTVGLNYGTWGYQITKVPRDPPAELAQADVAMTFEAGGLIFESAPLVSASLKRSMPVRTTSSSDGLYHYEVGWWLLLMVLLQFVLC